MTQGQKQIIRYSFDFLSNHGIQMATETKIIERNFLSIINCALETEYISDNMSLIRELFVVPNAQFPGNLVLFEKSI